MTSKKSPPPFNSDGYLRLRAFLYLCLKLPLFYSNVCYPVFFYIKSGGEPFVTLSSKFG